MAKFSLLDKREGYYVFECPGCKCNHFVNTNPKWGECVWNFNWDIDLPTVTPSILVQWTEGPEQIRNVCHSFITNGKIQFLGDCTHELAGQTIDLPEVE